MGDLSILTPHPRSLPRPLLFDYFLLHSEVFVDVRSCRIHHDTLKTKDSFGIGSDHKLVSLTLALPWDASNDTKKDTRQRGSQQKASRKRFMTEKLKNAAIQSEFTTELERRGHRQRGINFFNSKSNTLAWCCPRRRSSTGYMR